MVLTHVNPFPDVGRWLALGRNRYGLRPGPRPTLAGLASMLRRVVVRARMVLLRWSRPLPAETLVWILIGFLLLLFAVALFTRERAIAP